MTHPSLVRVARFGATHRYWRHEWSDDRNLAIFGEQAHPHEHVYRLEVGVSGRPDPETGFIVELPALDALLAEVVGPLDGRDLNEAIPEIRSGEMLPSTEALCRWFWERLEGRIPGSAVLRRVAVWESDELGAEIRRDPPPG